MSSLGSKELFLLRVYLILVTVFEVPDVNKLIAIRDLSEIVDHVKLNSSFIKLYEIFNGSDTIKKLRGFILVLQTIARFQVFWFPRSRGVMAHCAITHLLEVGAKASDHLNKKEDSQSVSIFETDDVNEPNKTAASTFLATWLSSIALRN